MKYLYFLLLLGCLFLNSCNKDEENSVEEIEITNVFYEDFFDKGNTNIVADSLYFINSEEKLKHITNEIPSVYTKLAKIDFNRNTIIISGTTQDYNIQTYEIKIFFDTLYKTCDLVFSYVLNEPPCLEKKYFRVWVCIVPKISYEPHKSYVHNNIIRK